MKMFVLFVAVWVVLFIAADATLSIAEELQEIHIPDTAAAEAYRLSQTKLHSMVATAYCLNGTTATGTQTREGVAAGKREWFGKTVRVYQNNGGEPGDLIGQYTIEDTGGKPIKTGSVIDIWMPTRDQCMAFGRKCVLVEVLD